MTDDRSTRGEFIELEGQPFYRIANYDCIPSFLMNVPSDTDLWMFIAASGGLTAGRVDAAGAVFPYETADKLHDGYHHTGPITLLRVVSDDGRVQLWEPFSDCDRDAFRIERNLYKNAIGNRVVFEECNHDLGLVFRYRWAAADAFGLVRTASVTNLNGKPVSVALLDGLRNVLPFGAPLALYQASSSLVDAYKRVDVDADTGLAMFSLTASIVDRPEAAESLRANTAWSCGLDNPRVGLSRDAVDAFRRGETPPADSVLKGVRANYFVHADLAVDADSQATWHVAVDAGLSHVDVAALRHRLRGEPDLGDAIEEALREADESIRRFVASADGIQHASRPETVVHHFANVLFNNMRGGVFDSGYEIEATDFSDFVITRNREVASRQSEWLTSLPTRMNLTDLLDRSVATGDADLERLSYEYLPLYFSRRHGDPSRPWNRFSIRVHTDDGDRALTYEGNWRDIFQNWQALAHSFPRFLPSMVAKFVNASTVDGFNPYRITRNGIDWEIEDPEDPWSHIGYWGDHQIVYLLVLLEAAQNALPGELTKLFTREVFSYANVPYRIKPYESLLEDPRHTIDFDSVLAADIDRRFEAMGSDARLVTTSDGRIYHVNLIEKIVVPVLSKLSNFAPDAGIWMNTQRPEWNDANNALAGNGASMVTLCYLRRHLRLLASTLGGLDTPTFRMSAPVATWLDDVVAVFKDHRHILDEAEIGGRDRRALLDALGAVFESYRRTVYDSGFQEKVDVETSRIVDLCQTASTYLDHAIRANRRDDGLYHAYNLLDFSAPESLPVRRLYSMLEGQVAALSSGAIDVAEAADLLDRMFESDLYSERHKSFLLYPERELPAFLDKNVIPSALLNDVPLLIDLLGSGNQAVVQRDIDGQHRFHGDFKNAHDLDAALDRLAEDDAWAQRIKDERGAVEDLFERVFDHAAFTGRSGTMYGYEGLGCVYWHMVAKLLIAVQEVAIKAAHADDAAIRRRLIEHYYRIRAGLGYERTVAEYGAFPTDPYSHTPPQGGARQPGMTGQVKEEILTRFGELGVHFDRGEVRFDPRLLREDEFCVDASRYDYIDLAEDARSIELEPNSLAFTVCQVPVVYRLTDEAPSIRVTTGAGDVSTQSGNTLGVDHSRDIVERRGGIASIEVGVSRDRLYEP